MDHLRCHYNAIFSHLENAQPQNIIDICGDLLGGEAIARSSGFIETPNYPTMYPPDVSCMCSLKPLQRGVSNDIV